MLNSVSIPLPDSSNEVSPMDSDHDQAESPTAKADADSPYNPVEESPMSTPDARLPSQTRGGVTNDEESSPEQLPRAKTREEQKKQMKPKAIKTLKTKRH